MKTLNVFVVNKIATYSQRGGCIVCGNSDYQIQFTFDSEWDSYTQKTARFIWRGQYIDVDFTGNTVTVPIVSNTDKVEVGVYAGDLHTTTSASISCEKSILCGNTLPMPDEELDKQYASEAKAAAAEAQTAATNAKKSETNASTYASTARTQATTATNQATAAKNSATEAKAAAAEVKAYLDSLPIAEGVEF